MPSKVLKSKLVCDPVPWYVLVLDLVAVLADPCIVLPLLEETKLAPLVCEPVLWVPSPLPPATS